MYCSLPPPSGRWARLCMPIDGPNNPIHWVQPMDGAGVEWLVQGKPTLRPLSTNLGFRARVEQALRATAVVIDSLDAEPDAPLQTTAKDGVWCLKIALGHQPTQHARREGV